MTENNNISKVPPNQNNTGNNINNAQLALYTKIEILKKGCKDLKKENEDLTNANKSLKEEVISKNEQIFKLKEKLKNAKLPRKNSKQNGTNITGFLENFSNMFNNQLNEELEEDEDSLSNDKQPPQKNVEKNEIYQGTELEDKNKFENENISLKKQVDYYKEEYEKVTKKLNENLGVIEETKKTYEFNVEKIVQENEERIHNMTIDYENRIKNLINDYDTQINNIQTEMNNQISKEKQLYDEQVKQIISLTEENKIKTELCKSYDKDKIEREKVIQSLQKDNDELLQQITLKNQSINELSEEQLNNQEQFDKLKRENIELKHEILLYKPDDKNNEEKNNDNEIDDEEEGERDINYEFKGLYYSKGKKELQKGLKICFGKKPKSLWIQIEEQKPLVVSNQVYTIERNTKHKDRIWININKDNNSSVLTCKFTKRDVEEILKLYDQNKYVSSGFTSFFNFGY